jgi:hypothetical protein
MARQKTSQARYYHARLNPINEHEAQAIGIIEKWEAEGINFKQLVVDRILRCEGFQPEMFDKPGEGITTSKVEALLNSFADEIVRHFKSASRTSTRHEEDEDDEGETSRFTRNFTRGFLQRQQQAEDDED